MWTTDPLRFDFHWMVNMAWCLMVFGHQCSPHNPCENPMWIVYQFAGPSAVKTSHSLPCGLVKCPAPAAVHGCLSNLGNYQKKTWFETTSISRLLNRQDFVFFFDATTFSTQLIGAASKTLLANKDAPGRMTLPIICNTVHSIVINILWGVSSMAFSVITIVIHDG